MLPKFEKWSEIGGNLYIPTEEEKATSSLGRRRSPTGTWRNSGPITSK